MNARRLSIAALLPLIAASAMAQEGTQDFKDQVLSSRSRAEVRQELAQARAAGELKNLGDAYGSFEPTEIASTLTRAEVLADAQLWREAGMNGFDNDLGYTTFTPEYRRAHARYLALASPRYAQLVETIARERGEAVPTMHARAQ